MTTPKRCLITHANDCGCQDRTPHACAQAHNVALYLWARDVTYHTVYDGECPYRFSTGDCDGIVLTVRDYPTVVVRHVLPLTIPVRAFHARGLYRWREDQDQVVCVIGDTTRRGGRAMLRRTVTLLSFPLAAVAYACGFLWGLLQRLPEPATSATGCLCCECRGRRECRDAAPAGARVSDPAPRDPSPPALRGTIRTRRTRIFRGCRTRAG